MFDIFLSSGTEAQAPEGESLQKESSSAEYPDPGTPLSEPTSPGKTFRFVTLEDIPRLLSATQASLFTLEFEHIRIYLSTLLCSVCGYARISWTT